MVDDPVVLALRTAIETADAVELRMALAEHFRSRGAHADALAELEGAMRLAPGNRALLEAAAIAAEEAGQAGKAQAYALAASHAPSGDRENTGQNPS